MRKRRKGIVLLTSLVATAAVCIYILLGVVKVKSRSGNSISSSSNWGERREKIEEEEEEMCGGVKKIKEATVSTFEDVFDKFKSEAQNNKANLILFLADKDPQTSLSWCPDCVRAEPVIHGKVEASSGDVGLLRAYVGDRPTWRNPNHPWRVDSRFKLTGVPTLIRWENESIKGRLEDHEAHVGNKIDALLA